MTTTAVVAPRVGMSGPLVPALAWRMARLLLGIGAIFWIGFSPLAVGIAASNAGTVGVTESMVGSMGNAPRGLQTAMGIVLVAIWLVPHVASGRTRRDLVTTAGVVVLATSVLHAGLMTAAFAVERPVYLREGWPLHQTTGHIFTSTDQYPLIFVENLAAIAACGLGGLLIGAGFRRWGALRGTFALPLTALPTLGAIAALEVRETSALGAQLGATGLNPSATLLVIAVLGAAGLLASYRVLHGAPAAPVLANS